MLQKYLKTKSLTQLWTIPQLIKRNKLHFILNFPSEKVNIAKEIGVFKFQHSVFLFSFVSQRQYII